MDGSLLKILFLLAGFHAVSIALPPEAAAVETSVVPAFQRTIRCVNSAVSKSAAAEACDSCKKGSIDQSLPKPPASSLVKGAYRVMATFYRSCVPVSEPPLDCLPAPYESDASGNCIGASGSYAAAVESGIRKCSPASARTGCPVMTTKIRFRGGERICRKVRNAGQAEELHYITSLVKRSTCPGPKECESNFGMYAYGAKPSLDANENELRFIGAVKGNNANGFCRGSAGFRSIDCSGFISAAVASSGLPIQPMQKRYNELSTKGWAETFQSKRSCFFVPQFEPGKTLVEGDIITVAGSHVVMVDKVGADPLGVKKAEKMSDCLDLGPEDWDFTIIQSAPFLAVSGVNRVTAKVYFGRTHFYDEDDPMLHNLRYLSQRACLQRFWDTKRRRDVLKGNIGSFVIGRHVTQDLAHDPDLAASCGPREDLKAPKLAGEKCVQGCIN